MRKGAAEIEGVPDRVVRAFSRRRAEIEHAMATAGAAGTNGARIAAFATRKAKDRRVRPEALVEEWRERAAILGFDRSRLAQVLDRGRVVEPDDGAWARIFAELAGPEGLTARRSMFTKQEVLREIAQRLPNGAPAEVIERAAERFLTSGRAVPLLAPRDPTERVVAIRRQDGRRVVLPHEPVYSTPELLAIERAIVDQALATRGVGAGLAREPEVERALARWPQLSTEQVEMVRRLTRDGDGIAVVVGRAGTGKTTALAAAREAWTSSDRTVVGCAVARRAAHELEQSADIPATSVAALLRRGAEGVPRSGVVVLDEAGMVGTRDLARLVALAADRHAKLVLVGDNRQLPALSAGGALRTLAQRLDPIVLRENRRQLEAWERDAVELLRDGSIGEAVSLYAARDRLVIGRDGEEVMRRLVAEWHASGDPGAAVMIAHRRRDVAELNGRARALLAQDGRLGPDALYLPAGAFAAGDHVVLKLNDSRLGVRNNERGVVTAVDLEAHRLGVDLADRSVWLPREYLESATQRGEPTLRHGYAITAYVAQGLTCERAYVLARDDAYREWAYTTMTRARDASHLYVIAERSTARDEFAPAEPERDPRTLLIAALSRSEDRGLAVEHELDRER